MKMGRDKKGRFLKGFKHSEESFTCQDCKMVGGNLEVHHINPLSNIIKEYKIKTMNDARRCEELWDLDNGITYCQECHVKNDKFRRIKK